MRKILVVVAAFLSFAVGFGALLVFRNSSPALANKKVDQKFISKELANQKLHDGRYFIDLAEKLQFRRHDPEDVMKLFETAILRSPANYRNYEAYAAYLVRRRCCADKLQAVLKQMTSRCKSNDEVYMTAAKISFATGNEGEGIEYFKRSLQLGAPLDDDALEILNEAGVTFTEIMKIVPSEPRYLLSMARYASSSDSEEVLAQIFQKLDGMNMDENQRLAAAKLAWATGFEEFARQQVTEVMKSPRLQPNALQQLAEFALQSNDLDEYVRLNEKREALFLASKQDESAASVALFTFLALSERNGPGLDQREQDILKKYGKHPFVLIRLARFNEKKSPERSVSLYQQALSLEPDNAEIGLRLASAYLKSKQFPEAEKIFKSLLESKYHTDAVIGLSRCYFLQGRPDQSVIHLSEALKQEEDDQEIWYELARVHIEQKDYQKAGDALAKGALLTSRKPEGFIRAGDAYSRAGDYRSAIAQYENALIIDPDNGKANKAVRQLKIRLSQSS